MYGLKQAAIVAYNHSIYHMDPHVYYPVLFTTVIWEHNIRRTKLCLCVDDFGVKYFTKYDANHLLDSLKNHYAISTDWEGCNHLGLKIDWNHSKGYVGILMPEYVKKALDRLQHPKPKIPKYAPHLWTILSYGIRLKMTPDPYNSNTLDKKSNKRMQSILGTMIYYAQLVDTMILREINKIL